MSDYSRRLQLGEIPAGRLGWYTGGEAWGWGVVTNLEPTAIAWTSADRAEALLKKNISMEKIKIYAFR